MFWSDDLQKQIESRTAAARPTTIISHNAYYVKFSSADGGPFGVSPEPQLPSQPDRNRGDSMHNHRTPAVAVVTVAAWPLEWAGWHFDQLGRLVSPERHRITPERLQAQIAS